MEKRTEEIKYEFGKLVCGIAMDDRFLEDSDVPSLTIAKIIWRPFWDAIITWETARRRLIEYRWPATWRDAFKERWFPAWAKRRWPVRYEEVAVDELAAIRREDDDKVRYFMDRGWL